MSSQSCVINMIAEVDFFSVPSEFEAATGCLFFSVCGAWSWLAILPCLMFPIQFQSYSERNTPCRQMFFTLFLGVFFLQPSWWGPLDICSKSTVKKLRQLVVNLFIHVNQTACHKENLQLQHRSSTKPSHLFNERCISWLETPNDNDKVELLHEHFWLFLVASRL